MKRKRLLAALLAGLMTVTLAPAALAASAYDRPGQQIACLTFDDGPGPYSHQILDVLAKHDAKATFFVVGNRLSLYADEVQRMVAEGHQVGSHTWNHPYLAELSAGSIANQLSSTSNLITQLTGLTGTGNTGFYLRPPYGSYNQRVATAANVPVIWCTVDSGDWKYQSSSRLVSYVGSNLHNGDIVIMHETHKTTANGLDALLTKLESRGIELVTVEELFFRRGIEPKAGGIYYSAKNTGVDRCSSELWFDESRLNTHWAWGAIDYVRTAGLMTGNQYGEFTPEFPLTRGMFVTVLGRLDGVTAGETTALYRDIPADHYAAPYALWARENGVMVGLEDGSFGVDKPLTRQEMAVALARYAAYRGVVAENVDLSMYADAADVADWAKDGVAACSALGLLQGSDGLFRPNEPTTRAMGATILQRLSEYDFPASDTPPAEEPPAEDIPAEEETA